MYSSTFIFAVKQLDETFHRLDREIAAAAKAIPGYQVVISEVVRTYGDGRLAGLLPITPAPAP